MPQVYLDKPANAPRAGCVSSPACREAFRAGVLRGSLSPAVDYDGVGGADAQPTPSAMGHQGAGQGARVARARFVVLRRQRDRLERSGRHSQDSGKLGE
jgi:hypothetical protein